MILAKHGEVRDDVHGGDVGCDDDDGGGVGEATRRRRIGRRFAQVLDDFLDASAQGLVLRGCALYFSGKSLQGKGRLHFLTARRIFLTSFPSCASGTANGTSAESGMILVTTALSSSTTLTRDCSGSFSSSASRASATSPLTLVFFLSFFDFFTPSASARFSFFSFFSFLAFTLSESLPIVAG